MSTIFEFQWLNKEINFGEKLPPYTQATYLPLGGIPLEFTAGGRLSDHRRVRFGNVINAEPLVKFHQRTAGVDIGGPSVAH